MLMPKRVKRRRVFRGRRHINANATQSPRVMLSMESFCQELISLNPRLDISMDASARDRAFLAYETGAPPIPLEAFPAVAELSQNLPDSIVRVRGVLPFAQIGNTLLVATLNPFDDALKQQIESAAGTPCRLYIANPRTMETTLDKIFSETALDESATVPAPGGA